MNILEKRAINLRQSTTYKIQAATNYKVFLHKDTLCTKMKESEEEEEERGGGSGKGRERKGGR